MKILIENYNLIKEQYEINHQEIIDLTLDELVDLFNKIPQKSDYPYNPVTILTDDFIFLKITGEDIAIETNITGFRSLPQLGDPFREAKLFGHTSITYKISDNKLESYISKGTKVKTRQIVRYRNLLLNTFLPIINIILIIFNIQRIIFNIGTIISFSVLLFLSFFTLLYQIRIAFIKPVQFRKLKYEIPFLRRVEPIEISTLVISFSQCFYFILFVAFSFSLDIFGNQIFIWSIIYFISIFILRRVFHGTILISLLWWKAKLAKEIIEQRILEKYHSEEIKEKSYYLNLYSLVKSKKLIKIGTLSKLMTLSAFLFTIVPILILNL